MPCQRSLAPVPAPRHSSSSPNPPPTSWQSASSACSSSGPSAVIDQLGAARGREHQHAQDRLGVGRCAAVERGRAGASRGTRSPRARACAAARACRPSRLTIWTRHSTKSYALTSRRPRAARPRGRCPRRPWSRTSRATSSSPAPSALARQLDDHRQVDARHHLDLALGEEHRGDVGRRPAEHVGQHAARRAPSETRSMARSNLVRARPRRRRASRSRRP